MKTTCPSNNQHNVFVVTHDVWLQIADNNEPKIELSVNIKYIGGFKLIWKCLTQKNN